ncbi:PEGA domain-containing protein [candidate division KSB1 bacterium]|nr:PEGA domain-containing protein [candidate division KSB1 bacterium]
MYGPISFRHGFVLGMIFRFSLCFFSPSVLFAQIPSPDTSLAFLTILSMPEGLPVFIDGKKAGTTPFQKFPVQPGAHDVVVRSAHATSWLDEDWQKQTMPRAGDTLMLVAQIRKGYLLNSAPYGAQVWREGELLGTTPYVLRLPDNETAHIELRLPSYQTIKLEVGGKSDLLLQKRNYDLVLERDLNFAAIQQQGAARQQAYAGKYRKLTYLSAALSVAAGVGSVLLKREADDAYEQYLTTGNPTRRDHYFNRAEKYDRYYGAAIAVFEVSFAVSFYSFLKSIKD